MNRLLMLLAITVTAGCLAPIQVHQPYPIKSVTYEFDKDDQYWTKRDCTTRTKRALDPQELETVCYLEEIDEPPPGLGE